MRQSDALLAGDGILGPGRRRLTAGIVIAVSGVACEGLGVTTIAARVSIDLGDPSIYGWVFTGYLLAQVLGTIVGGTAARLGMRRLGAVSALAFAGGLLVSGLASTPEVFVAGRVIQGLGAGGLMSSVYASVAVAYPDALRAAVFAAIGSAFVVPSLFFPLAAGVIADALGWRAVFLLLVAVIGLAGALAVPALPARAGHARDTGARDARWRTAGLAGVCASIVVGLDTAPATIGYALVACGCAGAVALARARRRGRPSGASRTIAMRALFTGGYFGAEAYLVLALTSLRGYSQTSAGAVVGAGAVSWAAAAWRQARLDRGASHERRLTRLAAGTAVMTAGVSCLVAAIAIDWLILPVVLLSHALLGAGMGLSEPLTGVVALSEVPEQESAVTSSHLLLADMLSPALCIAVAGAVTHVAGTSGVSPRGAATLALAACGSAVAASLTISAIRVRHRPGVA